MFDWTWFGVCSFKVRNIFYNLNLGAILFVAAMEFLNPIFFPFSLFRFSSTATLFQVAFWVQALSGIYVCFVVANRFTDAISLYYYGGMSACIFFLEGILMVHANDASIGKLLTKNNNTSCRKNSFFRFDFFIRLFQ